MRMQTQMRSFVPSVTDRLIQPLRQIRLQLSQALEWCSSTYVSSRPKSRAFTSRGQGHVMIHSASGATPAATSPPKENNDPSSEYGAVYIFLPATPQHLRPENRPASRRVRRGLGLLRRGYGLLDSEATRDRGPLHDRNLSHSTHAVFLLQRPQWTKNYSESPSSTVLGMGPGSVRGPWNVNVVHSFFAAGNHITRTEKICIPKPSTNTDIRQEKQ
ncbi:hypothetical protein HRR83_007590 [Exophiala dermatitidis]|uniref:Uncharacterized protein n=1 Tax=Exophiala dermatitidis TaxID=5970 RepID=A0AAN6ISA6_EXODE|nr:hypothetical protein HRR74_007171 [Exophiala dermatitidis]KAJ4521728.1 hypothetical protein HRR73_002926 [Exophiala dermatitidis]KAJ4548500.1 hypothetical protein HRR76_001096 [Exophiala dermatitidis]KAJ4565869.1 hypothetical protein HRR81_007536 [Exophiala dermatitidis]KAJ4574927.1 hypothetical protein HRR82_006374 [Exophiala dermatitidis]